MAALYHALGTSRILEEVPAVGLGWAVEGIGCGQRVGVGLCCIWV